MSEVKLDVSGDNLLLRYDAEARRPARAVIGAACFGVVGLVLFAQGLSRADGLVAVLGLIAFAAGCAIAYLALFATPLLGIDTRFDLKSRSLTIMRRLGSGPQSRTVAFDDVAMLACLYVRRPKRGRTTTVSALLADGKAIVLAPLVPGAPDRLEAMVATIRSATGLKAP